MGALLAAGALVRLSAAFYHELSGEDGTVALMAKHILAGENFPVFFYRQTYMGSLNGLHLVPALYVFGPSVLLVRLNAIAWSLLFPLGLYVLGRRIFDETTGRIALLLAAVPPFLLTYWSTVAEPHFETNTLGVVVLLLALAALTARSGAERARSLLAFGLVAGLAAWTSPKIVGCLGPAALLLLVQDPRLPIRRGGALAAGGFVLGGLPAWLFYVVRGAPESVAPGSATQFLELHLDLSPARLAAFVREVPWPLLGTYYWSPATPGRRLALGLNAAVYGAGLALLLLQAMRCGRRGGPPGPAAWGRWLVLLCLPAGLGALYVSRFGVELDHESSRYVLPLYVPLLLAVACLVARLARRTRAVAAVVLAFVLGFNLWTHERFLWPLQPAERAVRARAIAARQAVVRRLAEAPPEALYVDDVLRATVWAFLLDGPVVSALTTDVYVPSALAADAARRIAILAGTGHRAVGEGLAALGATWRTMSVDDERLFEDIEIAPRAYRMIPRAGWRVPGEGRRPPAVADGDLATAWPAEPPWDDPGRDLILDLGETRVLRRLVLWPAVETAALFPIRLSASRDAIRWDALGAVPAREREPGFVAGNRPVFRPRNGWLELAVDGRPVRYLRLSRPVDQPAGWRWGVTELYAYEDAGGPPPRAVDTDRLVERLRARGVRRLLADPVHSARVARATGGAIETLPANGVIDNHGTAPAMWLAAPVQVRPGDGLLVPREDAPDLRERLAAVGATAVDEPIEDLVLVRLLAPLPSGDPCTRPRQRGPAPAPGPPRGPAGLVLEADLGEERLVSGVRLRHPAVRFEALTVRVSRDGDDWQVAGDARVVPEWWWAGRTLFQATGQQNDVVFAPRPARRVRVELASAAGNTGAFRMVCLHARPAPRGGYGPR